jgi:hypothetical protein
MKPLTRWQVDIGNKGRHHLADLQSVLTKPEQGIPPYFVIQHAISYDQPTGALPRP